MFNNANVLFRIQTVNGSSQSSRIDNRGAGKNKRIAQAEVEQRPPKRAHVDGDQGSAGEVVAVKGNKENARTKGKNRRADDDDAMDEQ